MNRFAWLRDRTGKPGAAKLTGGLSSAKSRKETKQRGLARQGPTRRRKGKPPMVLIYNSPVLIQDSSLAGFYFQDFLTESGLFPSNALFHGLKSKSCLLAFDLNCLVHSGYHLFRPGQTAGIRFWASQSPGGFS